LTANARAVPWLWLRLDLNAAVKLADSMFSSAKTLEGLLPWLRRLIKNGAFCFLAARRMDHFAPL